MSCRLKGTYIGPHSVEIYVSDKGISQTENNIVHVDSLGQPFVFHTLADIESVSQSSGSENGGQFLTITGTGKNIRKLSELFIPKYILRNGPIIKMTLR